MWFKSKKPKIIPTVFLNGIKIEADTSYRDLCWKFKYKNIEFITDDHILNEKFIYKLDEYLSWVEKNKDFIKKDIENNLKNWGGTVESAYVALITIINESDISVMYLGDSDWGDLGVDYYFENGKITAENWGD